MKTEIAIRKKLAWCETIATSDKLDDPHLDDEDAKMAVIMADNWANALRWVLGLPNDIDDLDAGNN